jgi:hypothetical protein
MPTYVVTAPDGKEYEVTAPEGATQDEVLAYAKANYGKQEPSMGSKILRQLGLTARAAGTAATAIPSMLADPLASMVNQAAGKKVMELPSQGVQNLMTMAGLPEPQGGLERAVQAGASAMGGVAPQAALAKNVSALKPLTQNLGAQVATAAPAGMAAQVAAEGTKEATDSDLAAVIAGMVGGATVGNLAGKSVSGAKDFVRPKVSLDDIKAKAQANYQKMEAQGVALKPKSVLDMLDSAETNLTSSNFNPKLDTHKPVQQVLDQLKDMVGTQRVSFTKLEQMRSAATDLRASKEPATRKFAGQLVAEIDSYIGQVSPKDVVSGKGNVSTAVKAVQEARQDWRNLSKASILENALDVSEAKALDPKASQGELLRRQLINLAADKNKMRSFTEREQNAIKAAAQGGSGDPLLSLLARFNPERSQLAAGTAVVGGVAHPVVGVTMAGAGYGADKLQSFLRTSGTRRLMSDIAGGTLPTPGADLRIPGLMSSLYTQEEQ